ncbi:MAG: DUF1854 domain-containing protein [Polaromonas sp.]|nr:DUF1854 domain-containing protein [Polaromonas sp.]
MSTPTFELDCDAAGHWFYVSSQGLRHENVIAVRSFPVAAPDEGVALLDAEGHELLWIEVLDDLPAAVLANVERALTQREFMPRILKLRSVSSLIAPCTWDIETDRGDTSLLLKGEEDIRRLSATVLLVTDSHGVQFLIRDLAQMDRHSRKLLDRFL